MDAANRRRSQPQSGVAMPLSLLGLGLLLSAVLAMVGTSVAIWNFTDPSQRALISDFSKVLLVVVVLANFAPFVLAGAALCWARTTANYPWARAVQLAAVWTGVACVVSFFFTMGGSGGMP